MPTTIVVKVAGTGFLLRMKDSPKMKMIRPAANRIDILIYSPNVVFIEKDMTMSRMLLVNKAK